MRSDPSPVSLRRGRDVIKVCLRIMYLGEVVDDSETTSGSKHCDEGKQPAIW